MSIEEREVIYCEKDEEIFDAVKSSEIVGMKYHKAMGDGDAHYVDCYMNDGSVVRVFRPDFVTFAKEERKK